MKTTFKKLTGLLLVALIVATMFSAFALISSAEEAEPAPDWALAKIGDKYYATLAEAVSAVPKGTTDTPTTITLLKDQAISSLMIGHQYPQNIILDLGGRELTSNAIVLTAYRSGTTLTVQHGKISGNSTSGTLRATYGGKLILGDDLMVTCSGGSATLVYVDNGTVEIGTPNGVHLHGGKLTFKQSADVNNKVNVVASVGHQDHNYYYGTLKAALNSANEGETVTLLSDVTTSEVIAIDGHPDEYGDPQRKNFTIDGNGHTIKSTAARAINVSGLDGLTIKNLTIECTGERAINVIQNADKVTLDHVTATAKNYTVNVASSAPKAHVTIKNSTLNGLNTVNVAGAEAEVKITNSVINCNDNNTTVGESYAALCLNKDATNATITANGCTINVAEGSDSDVARNGAEGGVITIDDSSDLVKTVVALITFPNSNYYYSFYSLAEAIAYAEDGDTITLLRDINLTAANFGEKHDGYNTFFNISGKTITIDLNGKTITADVSEKDLDAFIIGVFCTTNNGHLTLKDSSTEKSGAVKGFSGTQEQAYLDASKGNKDYNYKFYSLIVTYDNDCSIVIEGGNYSLDFAGDSLAYTSCNEGIVVYGGTFNLGNIGGIRNGMPWIFNARGQNVRHVLVKGGSFCTDIQHQYYPFEVELPKELALKKGEDGMYTVVDAVAYVTEREWSSAWYTNEVGYATLEEAIAACEGPKTRSKKTSEQEVVVLLRDITLAENATIVINKTVAIDLNGFTIYGENTRTNTHNFLIDVKGGILTASNGTIAMKHTGTNMAWNGATTVIDVTAGGVLNLNGVTVQNQGGTDMNFAVHMNNWGEVTLNADNCTFDATYCGVRVFNSGYDMNNVKITNSKLTGATRAFWVHNYLGDLDSSKHSDEAIKARLNLDIYGNNNTFEITGTAKAPIRYGFNETVYFNAEGSQVVDSAEELQDAINNGSGDITLGGDIVLG